MKKVLNFVKGNQWLVFSTCLLLVFFATGLIKPGNVITGGDRAIPPADDLPVGTILAWTGDTASIPANWKPCNGKWLKAKKYPELYTAIGNAWGGNAKRLYLPDLRGRFIRGVDDGSGRDPDADNRTASTKGGNTKGIGSVQGASFQNHAHANKEHDHQSARWGADTPINYTSGGTSQDLSGGNVWTATGAPLTTKNEIEILGAKKHETNSAVSFGEETRPKNGAVRFIIKVSS